MNMKITTKEDLIRALQWITHVEGVWTEVDPKTLIREMQRTARDAIDGRWAGLAQSVRNGGS